ncbi:MAG: acyl carrier protein [Anaeroplasmataceae bacterium]|nr:acyl carrier protein [Anaeroplasmataceae bacterium]
MLEKIKKIVSENTFVEVDELNKLSGDDLLTQIGLDSINVVYIIGALEDEFGFAFADEDLLLIKFETFNKIEKLVKSYISASEGDSNE